MNNKKPKHFYEITRALERIQQNYIFNKICYMGEIPSKKVLQHYARWKFYNEIETKDGKKI